MKLKHSLLVPAAFFLGIAGLGAKYSQAANRTVSAAESQIVKYIDDHHAEALTLLETAVNINSGTNNFAGVSAVADLFEPRLQKLGFKTWREDMKTVKRGVHLFATHKGSGPRMLLIGHLDTIFEPESGFLKYKDLGNGMASGPGVGDMKGGDVVLLQVLEALQASGELAGMNISVAFTGDEETPGMDTDGTYNTTRSTLIDMGKQSDYVLAFEPATGNMNSIKTYRRGSSTWFMTMKAKTGHSSLVFNKDMGPGANYPVSFILSRFYRDLRTDHALTFNLGHVIGGTKIDRDTPYSAKVMGKDNVIPAVAEVYGDIRFLTPQILQDTRDKMRNIMTEEIDAINDEYDEKAHVSGTITFGDRYPAMVETAGNLELLGKLSTASVDLGFGPLVHFTANGGAADASFVAPYVKGVVDGLGPFTSGMHSTDEVSDLNSVKVAAKRAAVFMLRLHKGN
jgi:glutamate carboxypeptidase